MKHNLHLTVAQRNQGRNDVILGKIVYLITLIGYQEETIYFQKVCLLVIRAIVKDLEKTAWHVYINYK